MKKTVSILLAVILLLSLAGGALAEGGIIGGLPATMFVYTENGKTLNVRSEPHTGDNVIGHLKYGAEVTVLEFEGNWACIQMGAAGHSVGYVQSRFLQWYKPGPKPTAKPTAKPTPRPTAAPTVDPEKEREQEQLIAELNSLVEINQIQLQVQATRASGWVNMRAAPSRITTRIEACADGTVLTATGETTNWYRVTDPATGSSGYVSKKYVIVVPVSQPSEDEAAKIGTLNVNGEFQVNCKTPEGYRIQTISSQSTKIIAALTSDGPRDPQMMLTIAFSEMYSGIERMNDMSDEEIQTLKESYTELNEVEFTEGETALGTKILIAREVGEDEDFASVITVYKGYAIELVIAPNPAAAEQSLTDAQIQTGIDFLSAMEFVPAS